MRTFVILSHTVPTDGAWGLDDLAGEAGRVDVLCRAVTSALLVSHGIRDDTDVVMVFVADPEQPVAVRIRGTGVQHLNPDERSTAARIRDALRHAHPDPWWEAVAPGIDVAPFGVEAVLDELDAPVVWLDRDGRDASAEPLPVPAVWMLSDHRPFTEAERKEIAGRAEHTVGLGGTWYHGHHVVGIVHYLLDRQGPPAVA